MKKDTNETTIDGLQPDNEYKIKVIGVNTHGKSRYSKFVKIRTLNELEFVDLRVYKMSERVAVVKVKRKSIKQAIKFNWKATGLAEVRHFKISLPTGRFQILFSKKTCFTNIVSSGISFETNQKCCQIKALTMLTLDGGLFSKEIPGNVQFHFCVAKNF